LTLKTGLRVPFRAFRAGSHARVPTLTPPAPSGTLPTWRGALNYLPPG
jgi:hypothetical protein